MLFFFNVLAAAVEFRVIAFHGLSRHFRGQFRGQFFCQAARAAPKQSLKKSMKGGRHELGCARYGL